VQPTEEGVRQGRTTARRPPHPPGHRPAGARPSRGVLQVLLLLLLLLLILRLPFLLSSILRHLSSRRSSSWSRRRRVLREARRLRGIRWRRWRWRRLRRRRRTFLAVSRSVRPSDVMEKTVAAPRRPGEDPSCRRGAAENRLRGGVKSPFYTNVEFSNFKKN